MRTEAPPAPRRRRRWIVRALIGIVLFLGVWTCAAWVNNKRITAKGRELLAEAIVETDELDPRWRWDEIEADLRQIPDAENSMRVIRQAGDALVKWGREDLKPSDGGDLFD